MKIICPGIVILILLSFSIIEQCQGALRKRSRVNIISSDLNAYNKQHSVFTYQYLVKALNESDSMQFDYTLTFALMTTKRKYPYDAWKREWINLLNGVLLVRDNHGRFVYDIQNPIVFYLFDRDETSIEFENKLKSLIKVGAFLTLKKEYYKGEFESNSWIHLDGFLKGKEKSRALKKLLFKNLFLSPIEIDNEFTSIDQQNFNQFRNNYLEKNYEKLIKKYLEKRDHALIHEIIDLMDIYHLPIFQQDENNLTGVLNEHYMPLFELILSNYTKAHDELYLHIKELFPHINNENKKNRVKQFLEVVLENKKDPFSFKALEFITEQQTIRESGDLYQCLLNFIELGIIRNHFLEIISTRLQGYWGIMNNKQYYISNWVYYIRFLEKKYPQLGSYHGLEMLYFNNIDRGRSLIDWTLRQENRIYLSYQSDFIKLDWSWANHSIYPNLLHYVVHNVFDKNLIKHIIFSMGFAALDISEHLYKANGDGDNVVDLAKANRHHHLLEVINEFSKTYPYLF